jgi:hypothetical protein
VAKHKDGRKVSVLGAILVAAILGLVIGAVIYYEPGTPLPSPDDIEFKGEYDDSWGKLDPPAPRVGVSQVLITWTGASPRVQPKQPRTKEEARKLIEQIWHRFKNDFTPQNWKSLQKQHNEDAEPHTIYSVPSTSRSLSRSRIAPNRPRSASRASRKASSGST